MTLLISAVFSLGAGSQDKQYVVLETGKRFVNASGPVVELYRKAKTTIFTDASAFRGFWLKWRSIGALHVADQAKAKAQLLKSIPAVDFNKSVVVFIVGGPSQRPGHRLSVRGVVSTDTGIELRCDEHEGGITGAAIRTFRPYLFVAVTRPGKGAVHVKVRFVKAPPWKGPLPPQMAPRPGASTRGLPGLPRPRQAHPC